MIFFNKRLTKKEYLEKQLTRALWWSSRGRMPKKTRESLAKRTIARMDFNNPYQMHKSLEGYADILVANNMPEIVK